MFAARADQENAVHARQAAAAAKPLNQGLQGYTAKTPGNKAPKTPFKVPLNDENEVEKLAKGGLGTNGKGLGGKQQAGKAEKSLFQTPAPRDRPALGFKTTNAKATAFQTPAPKPLGPSPEKTQRRTVGRSRIQVHQEVKQAEPAIDWSNEEIQYIPPRPQPLPDVPSDDEWDKVDFSILKGANPAIPHILAHHAERAAKEDAEYEQRKKQDHERALKDADDTLAKFLQDSREPDSEDDEVGSGSGLAPRSIATVTSRAAASALSGPSASRSMPSYAAPTAATKARAPANALRGHKKTPSVQHTGRSANYGTLGYAKGRAVSSSIRQAPEPEAKLNNADVKPRKRKINPLRELEELVRAKEYEEMGVTTNELDDLTLGGGVMLPEEEEEELFQFKIPDDL